MQRFAEVSASMEYVSQVDITVTVNGCSMILKFCVCLSGNNFWLGRSSNGAAFANLNLPSSRSYRHPHPASINFVDNPFLSKILNATPSDNGCLQWLIRWNFNFEPPDLRA